MKIKVNSLIFLFLMNICFISLIYPDRVVLNNDNVIKGDILFENNELIRIKTAGGVLEVRKSDIKDIQKENLFSDFLKLEEIQYGGGDLEEIFRDIYKNVRQEEDLKLARESLIEKRQFIYDNVTKNSQRYKSEELDLILKKFIENQEDSEFVFFLFTLFKTMGDTPRAIKYCLQILPEYFEHHPNERKEILTFLSDTIQSLSKKDEIEQLFELIDYVSKIDKEIADSLKIIIYLRLAHLELQNGFYDKALNIYVKDIMPISNDVAKTKVNECVKKRIESLLENNQYEDAKEFFNKYSTYFEEKDKKEILSNILKKYSDSLFLAGDFLKAKDTYSEYYTVMDSKEIPLVKRCEYEIRLREIEDNDYEARYKLGLFCEENKLYDLAKKEFEFVANNDNQWKKNAELHLTVIKKEEELKDFEEIMNDYQSEDFEKVADLSKEYVNKHPESELLTEISEILKISLKKKELEKYKKKSKEILLYQLAEREYLKYNFSKALEYVDELLKSVPDKNLREKAEFLKYRITQAKELKEIESVDENNKQKTLNLDAIKQIK